jgi:hypothetical protein
MQANPSKSKCSACGAVGHNKRNKKCPSFVTSVRKAKSKENVMDPIVEYLNQYFGDKIPETPDELHAKLTNMDDKSWNAMIASCGPEYKQFKRKVVVIEIDQ